MPNLPNRLARWGGSALLMAAMLATGPMGAQASSVGVAVAAPASPDAVLWAQTAAGNTNGGTTASSKFEPLFSTYSSQAADDFENTGSTPWQITQVNLHGTYEGGTGNSVVTSLLIQVYSNNIDQPGLLLISQTVPSAQITGLATGDFTVSLSPPLIVGPGRYWLSAQAYKPDFLATGRQWSWYEKEIKVLNGSVWKQPGDAYGKHCLIFLPRVATCDQPTNSENYDLLFQVIGNAGANNPVPILTGINPGSRTPGGPNFNLVLSGVNFVSSSQVLWNGLILTPTAATGNRLTVTVPSGYIVVSGPRPIKVRNVAPGGGDSNTINFFIGTRIALPFIRR